MKTNYLSSSTTSLEENIITSLNDHSLTTDKLDEYMMSFSKHVNFKNKYIHVVVSSTKHDSLW
jgi:hypothetical protein